MDVVDDEESGIAPSLAGAIGHSKAERSRELGRVPFTRSLNALELVDDVYQLTRDRCFVAQKPIQLVV